MYSLTGHGKMISDDVRMNAYVRALGRHVKPGSTVLDIGTGTGVFALLASRLGAKRVYAVEPEPVIQVGRDLAMANGCASSIEFIQEVSTRIRLPERVDVIVSDLRGVLPPHGDHLQVIMDARDRLLLPRGTLIGSSDEVWVAAIEAPDLHCEAVAPWAADRHGLDLRPVRSLAVNDWRREVVKPDQFLTPPVSCGVLDYTSIDSPDFKAEISMRATRAGTGHGLAAWFDATLADGVIFSNAPGAAETVYGNAYFPWPEPVELRVGDTVKLQLAAKADGEGYVWSWRTEVHDQAKANGSKADFRQSTFLGRSLPLEHLRKTSAAYMPTLTGDGQLDRDVLTLMDGCASIEKIAQEIFDRFPGRFSRLHDALRKVSELSARYAR
jgi:protein arginine N-methyltransferase 1